MSGIEKFVGGGIFGELLQGAIDAPIRKLTSTVDRAPRIAIKKVQATITTGQAFQVEFGFKPDMLLVVRAVNRSTGAQIAVEPIPEWVPTEDGARVREIGGIAAGTRVELVLIAGVAGEDD